MPFPYVNAKAYSLMQFEAVKSNGLTPNLVDHLSELARVHLSLSDDELRQCKINLDRHIGLQSTYTHKQALIHTLNAIYNRIISLDPVLSDDARKAVFLKLSDNIKDCSPGFHNRVNGIYQNSFITISLDGFLAQIRWSLVNRAATQWINKVIKEQGAAYIDEGREVHLYNDFFKEAHSADFGVHPLNSNDVYHGNLSGAELFSIIKQTFDEHYTVLGIFYKLMEMIRDKVTAEQNYNGDNPKGQVYEDFSQWIELLNKLFPGKDAYNYLIIEDEVLDADENVIKELIIRDIDWLKIEAAFFQRLVSDRYFNLSAIENTCLKQLLGLEIFDDAVNLSCLFKEETSQGLISNQRVFHYLLSMMANRVTPQISMQFIQLYLKKTNTKPSILVLMGLINLIEKNEDLLCIFVLNYEDLLLSEIRQLAMIQNAQLLKRINDNSCSWLTLIKHAVRILNTRLTFDDVNAGFTLSLYLDDGFLMAKNLPEADSMLSLLYQSKVVLDHQKILMDQIKQHYGAQLKDHLIKFSNMTLLALAASIQLFKSASWVALMRFSRSLIDEPIHFKDIQAGLLLAVHLSDEKWVNQLIDNGADFKSFGRIRLESPLEMAISHGANEIAEIFLFRALSLPFNEQNKFLSNLPGLDKNDTVLSYVVRCKASLFSRLVAKLKQVEHQSILDHYIEELLGSQGGRDLETNLELLDVIQYGIRMNPAASRHFFGAVYLNNVDKIHELVFVGEYQIDSLKPAVYKKLLAIAMESEKQDLVEKVMLAVLSLPPLEQETTLIDLPNAHSNDTILSYAHRCNPLLFQSLVITVLETKSLWLNNVPQFTKDSIALLMVTNLDTDTQLMLFELIQGNFKYLKMSSPDANQLFIWSILLDDIHLMESMIHKGVDITDNYFPQNKNALDFTIAHTYPPEMVLALLMRGLLLNPSQQLRFTSHVWPNNPEQGLLMNVACNDVELFNALAEKLKEAKNSDLLIYSIQNLLELNKKRFNEIQKITPLYDLINTTIERKKYIEVGYLGFQWGAHTKNCNLISRFLNEGFLPLDRLFPNNKNGLDLVMTLDSLELIELILSNVLKLNLKQSVESELLKDLKGSAASDTILTYTARVDSALFNRLMKGLISREASVNLKEKKHVFNGMRLTDWELAVGLGDKETVSALLDDKPSLVNDPKMCIVAAIANNQEAICIVLGNERWDSFQKNRTSQDSSEFVKQLCEFFVKQFPIAEALNFVTTLAECSVDLNINPGVYVPYYSKSCWLRSLCNDIHQTNIQQVIEYALKNRIESVVTELLYQDDFVVEITPEFFYEVISKKDSFIWQPTVIIMLVRACQLPQDEQKNIICKTAEPMMVLTYLMRDYHLSSFVPTILIELSHKNPNIKKKIEVLKQINFDAHLEKIKDKITELEIFARHSFIFDPVAENRYQVARKLYDDLIEAKALFLQPGDSLANQTAIFKANCKASIKQAMPVLEQHRGWKQILTVLFLVLAFPIALPLYAAGFFSLKTDSADKLISLDKALGVEANLLNI